MENSPVRLSQLSLEQATMSVFCDRFVLFSLKLCERISSHHFRMLDHTWKITFTVAIHK